MHRPSMDIICKILSSKGQWLHSGDQTVKKSAKIRLMKQITEKLNREQVYCSKKEMDRIACIIAEMDNKFNNSNAGQRSMRFI